jgi:hypothetical protein
MLAAGFQVLVSGLYNSVAVVLDLRSPPTINTSLVSNNTAACPPRGVARLAAELHVPVVGSYNSALSRGTLPEP